MPVSPEISTVASVAATCLTSSQHVASSAWLGADDLVEALRVRQLLAQILRLDRQRLDAPLGFEPLVHVAQDEREEDAAARTSKRESVASAGNSSPPTRRASRPPGIQSER